MIAVFCETPFQLLNALNLVYSVYKEDCILYLCKDMYCSDKKFDLGVEGKGFVKAIKYTERVGNYYSQFSLFDKIILKLKKIIFGRIKMNLKTFIPGIDLNQKYSRIICIKYSVYAEWLYEYLLEKPEVVQVEEGIGEYLVLDDIHNESPLVNITEKKYILEPKLYAKTEKFKVEKAPKYPVAPSFNSVIDYLFQYHEALPYYRKYIYFSQAFAVDYNNAEFDTIEDACFSVLQGLIPNDIVIKSHPRNEVGDRTTLPEFYSLIPWESCINELPLGIENTVLLSVSSTAIATPKLMFDNEPIIIILAKIFENQLRKVVIEDTYYERLIIFFNSIKDLYSQKEKVYMPESIDELREIICEIEEKIPLTRFLN